jgi:hypothetical protein
MTELLDDNRLIEQNEWTSVPTFLKVVGLLLLLVWSAAFVLGIRFYFYLEVQGWGRLINLVDVVLLATAIAVVGRCQHYAPLQQVLKQGKQLLLATILLLLTGYFINRYSERVEFSLLKTTARMGLLYSLSLLVLGAYEVLPQASNIWRWMQEMLAVWVLGTVALWKILVEEGGVYYRLMVYFIVGIYFISSTLKFYKNKGRYAAQVPDKWPTAFFISSVTMVIGGQVFLLAFSIRLAMLVAAFGVGLGWLTALYAWIKHTPDAVE